MSWKQKDCFHFLEILTPQTNFCYLVHNLNSQLVDVIPARIGSILFCFPIKISVICQGAEDVDILSWICSKLILQT